MFIFLAYSYRYCTVLNPPERTFTFDLFVVPPFLFTLWMILYSTTVAAHETSLLLVQAVFLVGPTPHHRSDFMGSGWVGGYDRPIFMIAWMV